MKYLERIRLSDIFFGCFPLAVVLFLVYFVAHETALTPLDVTLLQFLEILVTSFSVVHFTKRASESSNQDRARLALRRIASIYRFFPNFINSIQKQQSFLNDESDKSGKINKGFVNLSFEALTLQVYQQINTVNDAVDDWKDLVPDAENVIRNSEKKEN